MTANSRFNFLRRSIAAVAAAAALLTGAAAFADGGGGSGTGDGIGGEAGNIQTRWIYAENYGTPTVQNVKNAIAGAGSSVNSNMDGIIQGALNQAQGELASRGGKNGRIVGIGYTTFNNTVTSHATYSSDIYAKQQYNNAWLSATSNKRYNYKGYEYGVATPFPDAPGRSVMSIAGEQISAATRATEVIVLVLAQNEPRNPIEPPAPPSKSIQRGVSADAMTNTTTILQGTGIGGSHMTITDHIDPHGASYTVSNIHIVDTSAGNSNIDGQFSLNWNQSANTVTAVRTASGLMPEKHNYRLTFDVTVSRPQDFDTIDDYADTLWEDKHLARTDTFKFPKWKPTPDKSWVFYKDGKWQAVIDPARSNRTGADEHTFLDGDKVGSVVNGTVGANLIEAPTAFGLSDDWTKADYIFDAADASKIRVYEADASTDRQSSVSDIVSTGADVTDQFTITVNGTKATATMKASALTGLKGLAKARQYTLLVPGTIDFANGKGAAQVRKDFGKKEGDQLTFCTNPDSGHDSDGAGLTNSASETLNGQTEQTNEPRICGYVPPVKKDVVSEASQGGDQDSVDGKAVYPGQKVEYQLLTRPDIPASLAYEVTDLSWTDQYDQYLKPDKQTLEMVDLTAGRSVPKSKYTTKWDDEGHSFTLTVTDKALLAQWRAGSSPRLQVRFEGTVSTDAPAKHEVDNQWTLRLNNSLTPSNRVVNTPPDFTPKKADVSKDDPSISIDGKKLLLGDKGVYRITLDAHQANTAYKVWRLGIVDDYDEKHLAVDAKDLKVLDQTGRDVTSKFNVQIEDGIAYVFAKTVDTAIPATGETVKGDPQPSDLKAYSAKGHDPLHDAAIDQSLLGQTYTVVMPYTVSKVDDGYVVRNTATQIENDQSKETNEVSNPLVKIDPKKDVVVNVGSASADGKDIYLDHYFLYRLDSSKRPADLAYPQVSEWAIADKLDTTVDQYTGQWAVYANADLYSTDGQLIARKGEKIAGSAFDTASQKQGGILTGSDQSLFTVGQAADGTVAVAATASYRRLVSDGNHDAAWTAYIQVKRLKPVEHHDNQFTETINGTKRPSNIVWTRTPDQTPKLRIEKFDTKSGLIEGDRNKPSQALTVSGATAITVRVWNEGKSDIHGLTFSDKTIAGDGNVQWDQASLDALKSATLHPGDHIDVTGTLPGVKDHHTDRATVKGTPLLPCPAEQPDIDRQQASGDQQVKYCDSTPIQASDDWNGKAAPRKGLASTGSAVMGAIALTVILLGGGMGLVLARRRGTHAPSNMAGAHEA